MSKSSVIWIVLGIILALAIGYGIAQIVDKTQEHLIFYAVNGLPADAVSFSVNPVKPNEASVLTIDTSKLDSQTTYTCTLIARADKPVTN